MPDHKKQSVNAYCRCPYCVTEISLNGALQNQRTITCATCYKDFNNPVFNEAQKVSEIPEYSNSQNGNSTVPNGAQQKKYGLYVFLLVIFIVGIVYYVNSVSDSSKPSGYYLLEDTFGFSNKITLDAFIEYKNQQRHDNATTLSFHRLASRLRKGTKLDRVTSYETYSIVGIVGYQGSYYIETKTLGYGPEGYSPEAVE